MELFGLGIQELLVILVILLFVFGAKKLPELARSIGESARELRRGFTEDPKKASDEKTAEAANNTETKN